MTHVLAFILGVALTYLVMNSVMAKENNEVKVQKPPTVIEQHFGVETFGAETSFSYFDLKHYSDPQIKVLVNSKLKKAILEKLESRMDELMDVKEKDMMLEPVVTYQARLKVVKLNSGGENHDRKDDI